MVFGTGPGRLFAGVASNFALVEFHFILNYRFFPRKLLLAY
jgi:hypothetical protein